METFGGDRRCVAMEDQDPVDRCADGLNLHDRDGFAWICLAHVEGCLGFIYDRMCNVLIIRLVLGASGGPKVLRIVGRDTASDLSTARSRACRARRKKAASAPVDSRSVCSATGVART